MAKGPQHKVLLLKLEKGRGPTQISGFPLSLSLVPTLFSKGARVKPSITMHCGLNGRWVPQDVQGISHIFVRQVFDIELVTFQCSPSKGFNLVCAHSAGVPERGAANTEGVAG
jgi:hypothetical protein